MYEQSKILDQSSQNLFFCCWTDLNLFISLADLNFVLDKRLITVQCCNLVNFARHLSQLSDRIKFSASHNEILLGFVWQTSTFRKD